MRLNTVTYIVVAALAAGCGRQNPAGSVAKVNGELIALSSFETAANRVGQVPGKDLSSGDRKRELLDEVIKQELLYQAAVKDGILGKSDRLKKELAREYLNEKIGRERYEPTDQEIQVYFESKKGEMEKVRASHILIKPKNPADPKSWDEAKARANMVLSKIKAQGEKADFAKLAREYSEDMANKDKGGELFYFERGKMVPEFSDVAFNLKVGELGDPVKTQFGYHIIKVTGEQKGVDTFKQAIKWQIAMDKRKEKADKLFQELKNKASIKVFDEVLAKANISGPAGGSMN